MTFTEDEISIILSDFPKFELSYESMTYQKVHNFNIILAIPDGQTCFAWFTSYKDDNVCFIMEIDKIYKNKITNIYPVITGFDDKLAYGTVLYGTVFSANGSTCFCIEDLYYYKGVNYTSKTFITKLNTLKSLFKSEISQQAIISKYMIFGLPLMGTELIPLLKNIELLPYKIMYLKYRWFETKKIMCAEYFSRSNKPSFKQNYNSENRDINIRDTNIKPINTKPINIKSTNTNTNTIVPNNKKKLISQNSTAVFHITPDVQSDIYNLFVLKNGKIEFYDYAFISDYETSVKMNKLFRNIKENDNLDALEESDDEDDFQDERRDKYVYLDRSYKMICKYNFKFNKWMPISLANSEDQIVSENEIYCKSKI
jgi:hypothetical protein